MVCRQVRAALLLAFRRLTFASSDFLGFLIGFFFSFFFGGGGVGGSCWSPAPGLEAGWSAAVCTDV